MARQQAQQRAAAVQRAALYPRVSTGKQEEEGTSLATQEQRCREYAAAHGYTVAEEHVYREVHTGTELWERPKLTALRAAIRAREVDVLVVFAIDRLSRDPVHLGVILSEADHAGVRVEFVSEPLDDSPEGQLIRFVRGYAAKVEHEKIKERTIRGRRARAEAGRLSPGARAMYGYRFNDDRSGYLIEPATAPLLQRMFVQAAQGTPVRAIAARLTRDGIPSPTGRGAVWQPKSVWTMLTNPAYTGQAVAWRWARVKNDRHGTTARLRPETEHIALPAGTIPPLIDPALFAAVQARLAVNKQQAARNNRAPEETLLRGGYAVCGNEECGRVMVVHRNTSRGYTYTTYRCSRSSEIGGCSHNIAAHQLDGAVWGHVAHLLTRPELIAAELARMETTDPSTADLEAVERSLSAIAREQRNYVESLGKVNGVAADLIAQKINALEAQREQHAAERAAILARRTRWQQARERLGDLQAWCRSVAAKLATMTYSDKRLALDALGVRVTVWPTGHEPRYRIDASIPLDAAPDGIVCSTSRGTPHNAAILLRWTDRDPLPAAEPAAAVAVVPA